MTTRASEQWLSQGQRLLRQGKWEEAERALQQAVKQAPEYRWPRLYLALARADAGRTEEALPEMDRALEMSPDSAVLRVFRARILCDAGRYDEALEALQEALERDPHYGIAHGYQALALLGRGEAEEAERRWKQAPEEPPSALLGRMLLAVERIASHAPSPEETPIELPEAALGKPGTRQRLSPRAAAALKRARRAYMKERLDEAREAYLAALRADPALAEAWLELAITIYEQERYPMAREALERYRQAAGEEDGDPHYRAYKAACEAKLGNPDAALELLEGADPKQPVVPYSRGLAMLAQERIPEARHALIQFAAMMPRLAQTRIKGVLTASGR